MQLKKLLQGSAFALVAAACAIAIPSVVKADTTDTVGTIDDAGLADVTYNEEDATLTITGKAASGSGNSATPGTLEVQVGFGKVKNNEIKVSTWDTYDVKHSGGSSDKVEDITVDLSKLSNVKDNYVVISTPGSENDKMIVKIPSAPKKIKAKFNAASGELEAGSGNTATAAKLEVSTVKSNALDKAGSASIYEFRTAYSDWTDIETEVKDNNQLTGYKLTDLSFYRQEGAKLFVRVKGTPTTSIKEQNGKKVWEQSTDKLKYGDVDTPIYVAGTLPGKEAKVTVPAMAKGPKATADYTKGTVKFANGCEYRISTADKIYAHKDNKDTTAEKDLKEATNAPTSATTIKKLYEDVGANLVGTESAPVDLTKLAGTIEVRKAAKGTKAASKWGVLSVELPMELKTGYYGNGKGSSDPAKVYDKPATESNPQEITESTTTRLSQLTIIQGAVDPKPEKADTDKKKPSEFIDYGDKGVKLSKFKESDSKTDVLKVTYTKSSNKENAAPAIQISNSGERTYEIVVKKETNPKNISDAEKATKVAPNKTVTIKNVEDGACVFVRFAGDKKNTKWVSQYGNFGTIDLKKQVAGTSSAS